MGSRSRSHILEDESRIQFKLVLPPEWVVRDKTSDYGVDCEVEIFDKEGNTTGNVFWVQLKATDSKNEKTQLNFQINKSKLSQLAGYNIPVLFIRYISATKSFYYLRAKKAAFLNSSKKSVKINIQFSKAMLWDDNTPMSIKASIEKLNNLKKIIEFPIPLFIENVELSTTKAIRLRSSISHYNQLINIKKDTKEAIVFLYLYKEKIVVTIMDEYGTSIGIKELPENISYNERITKLVFVGILIGLTQMGNYEMFDTVINSIDLKDSLSKNPEILLNILPFLFKGEKIQSKLDLLLECTHSNEDISVNIATEMLVLINQQKTNYDTLIAVKKFLEKKLYSSESDIEIGIRLYNLGSFYRERGNYLKAFNYYNKARKSYPQYMKTSYFNKILGGIFFELEKFNYSSVFYKKAIEVEDKDILVHALLGDAMLFSGNYKKAKHEYNYFLVNNTLNEYNSDEWQLKYTCIATLLDHGHPTIQKRNNDKAISLSSRNKLEDDKSFFKRLREALYYDLLCGITWFNLGLEYIKKKELKDSFISFLMCSLIDQNNAISWVNCTLLSLDIQETYALIPYIVNTAHYYCGDNYIFILSEILENQNFKNRDHIIEYIDNLIKEPEKKRLVFRLIDKNDNFTEFGYIVGSDDK